MPRSFDEIQISKVSQNLRGPGLRDTCLSASDVAPGSSSSPSWKATSARMTAKLPEPRGSDLRLLTAGAVAVRRWRSNSPGARKSKFPWSSAQDQPAPVRMGPEAQK